MSRAPVRDHYDARVLLLPRGPLDHVALCLVKLTLAVAPGGRLVPAPAEPLAGDLFDPGASPRLPAGSDYWPAKPLTDVAALGRAFAPGGRPCHRMEVRLTVGRVTRRLAVFGRRAVTWGRGGRPRIAPPEPFTELPLTWEHAYGGVDCRVAPGPGEAVHPLALACDHPGLYPRNPLGKGYLVVPGPVPGMEMPEVEDPDDLLTPERLVTGDPRLCWRQPLPAGLGWWPAPWFPRPLLLDAGADAWYPGPDDARLPEVARGLLPPGFRAALHAGRAPDLAARFAQEAPHGLALAGLPGGAPVEVAGMHPERPEVAFRLPEAPPPIALVEAGAATPLAPRLHNVAIHPAEERVTLTYAALATPRRRWLPGVHREIPLAIRVAGDAPVPYEAPPAVLDRLEAAGAGVSRPWGAA